MPEVAAKLAAVSEAAHAVREADANAERARRGLQEALRTARKAGASLELLGQLAGLSRQRVAQIIERDR
jgi:hypothetical protein